MSKPNTSYPKCLRSRPPGVVLCVPLHPIYGRNALELCRRHTEKLRKLAWQSYRAGFPDQERRRDFIWPDSKYRVIWGASVYLAANSVGISRNWRNTPTESMALSSGSRQPGGHHQEYNQSSLSGMITTLRRKIASAQTIAFSIDA
jgi:hypothetical protein